LTDNTKARGRVDFDALNRALMGRIESLLSEWIGGRRDGPEWLARRKAEGGLGDSLKVTLATGAWFHFADQLGGGDLVSLHAYVFGGSQIDSARELWQSMGLGPLLDDGGGPAKPFAPQTPARASEGRGASAARTGPAEHEKRRGDWTPVVPVPKGAPEPSFVHSHRGVPALTWVYRRDGELFGHVCRFTTSDGGKETLPLTWCRNDHDPVNPGAARWHWKGWDAPRPLYLPSGTLPEGRTVGLVEGEKCAEALHHLLGDELTACTWPGGTNAVAMADWAWLAGRRVVIWADTDSHREKLGRDEQDAIKTAVKALELAPPEAAKEIARRKAEAQLVKPYLPLHEQPGNKAALKIAELLHILGCTVFIVPFMGPGIKPDGWDVADAAAGLGVEAPWGAEQAREHMRSARRYEAPKATQNEAAKEQARAEQREVVDRMVGDNTDPATGEPQVIFGWPHYAKEGPKATRENVLHAFKHDPALRGLVGLNEFSQEMWKLKPTPWVGPTGIWREVDDYKLAEYLVLRHDWAQSPSADSIGQALKTVSMDHAFHPVRDRLKALTWDKTDRLGEWLFEALSLNANDMPPRKAQYIAAVGKWFIMGMVARVLRPGCKFDYMLVLEGPQGYRKSTLGRVLAGDYFSDTHLDLGNKDSYLQLQGCWVHEFSELHAITGKDVTLVKAFVSAQIDYLRAPFDRRPAKYPRQCVFFGTSNNNKWARDRTGNRRMWPIEISVPVRTEWVQANLDQLLAEALHRVKANERFFPTHEEELAWFQPEQAKRVQTTQTEEALMQFLCGDRTAKGWSPGNEIPERVTLLSCLEGVGIDVAKGSSNRNTQSEVIELLHKWGWVHKKSSKIIAGKRPWVYERPEVWPPAEPTDAEDESFPSTAAQQAAPTESSDDVPFC
jgi:putative DNA primase/helicase